VAKPRRLQEWARALPLAELLADALPRRAGKDPLLALAGLTGEELGAACQALRGGLERLLRQALGELRAAVRAGEARQQGDAAGGGGGGKFSVIPVSCGGIADFHAGVEARTGGCPRVSQE
jgi:hypothetical protein